MLSEVPHELSIPMRTPKSANGPRSNSFRPDSPSAITSHRDGRLIQPSLATPDMFRYGRVLRTSVKLYSRGVFVHIPIMLKELEK